MNCKGDIQIGTACRKCERCLELGWGERVLRLTVKRKWFDMIASGEKREEYRTPGKWILSRLIGKNYDVVEFSNGYGKHVPIIVVKYLGWHQGPGRSEWGGTWQNRYVVIRLGHVISRHNAQAMASADEKTPPKKPTL